MARPREDEFKVKQQKEIERNYEYFRKLLPKVMDQNRGRFALLRSCRVIQYFDTARDGYITGLLLYPDRIFSLQEVVELD